MAKQRQNKSGALQAHIRSALEEGRFAEAWTLARGGLARTPKNPAMLNLAGVAAYHAGDAESARELLAEAAARRPRDSEIHMNLGNVLGGVGDGEGALTAYATAADLKPDYAEPPFNAGVLLDGRGRLGEAVLQFEAALTRDPEHTAAAIALAETFRKLGNLSGAEDVLTRLVARDSGNAVALTNLSAAIGELGRPAEALKMAERAAAADPGLGAAHYNLGVHALALGDGETAFERFRRALALDPGNAAAALNLGEAALTLGDREEARRAFARALEIDPGFAKAAVNFADFALMDGDAGEAVARIDHFLSREPGEPSAFAFKAFALRDAGRAAEAEAIADIDRFLHIRDIDPPSRFADIDAFNEALASHVLSHPTLTEAPASHATRDGRHSGELLQGDAGPIGDLAEIVQAEYEAYCRRFAGEPSHPFLDRKPDRVRLSVWAVVMETGGHQVAHIHPSAWLSGVYYVEVPDSVREDDADNAGWIEFGRAPEDIHTRSTQHVRAYLPNPGKMILFPSYFYHRTVPLSGAKRRISIAFDILPL